jgi:hypothetical protein
LSRNNGRKSTAIVGHPSPNVSTEALGSARVGLSEAATVRTFGALPADVIVSGLKVGGAAMTGSWLSKQLMHRIRPDQLRGLMEALLWIARLLALCGARRHDQVRGSRVTHPRRTPPRPRRVLAAGRLFALTVSSAATGLRR